MICQIFPIFCTFRHSTMELLRFVTARRDLFIRHLKPTQPGGLPAGTTHSCVTTLGSAKNCSLTEAESVDVAIREIGQLLNVGSLSGVTYDVPAGVPGGTNHLHVSFMLFRVADEQ